MAGRRVTQTRQEGKGEREGEKARKEDSKNGPERRGDTPTQQKRGGRTTQERARQHKRDGREEGERATENRGEREREREQHPQGNLPQQATSGLRGGGAEGA
jgi:hypothetical protein